ncbi:type I phosphodiesterase [Moesziomyces antarcticus T-34]|uniref:Type I phosphodiesterase n=1 Tax=Pseudozyma antarctica (strain T-34) TaxID=1151754 RepID=M9MCQ4_PSEA3|nr:type I phosphodiesterase [Moesziomyces antarcticus T-34]
MESTAESSTLRSSTHADNTDAPEATATTPLLPRAAASHERKSWSRYTRLGLSLTGVLILGVLVLSLLGLHPAADDGATSLWPNATLSNGTHTFRRTVILISLDGAKPVYLDSGHARHIQSLSTQPHGRRAEYMQPVFPTLTFPNHWALLTGLYASSHGIVANDFTLGTTHAQFYYTDPRRSWSGSWWLGEPIWATVQRAGLSAAVLMWPGPPVTAAGVKPRYFQKYASGPEWDLQGRKRAVLDWIDMANVQDRPSLICAYVPDIDQAAHRFGPNSTQALQAVRAVDAFVGELHTELVHARNLGGVVDVVVVSDHGMTSTSNARLVFLDQVLDAEVLAAVQTRDAWPLAGLRFRGSQAEQDRMAQLAYTQLKKDAKGYDVFWRQELPERWHLNSSTVRDRLAPLWMVPWPGWSITDHAEFATFANGTYAPRGNHGYDNTHPDMHAIFAATGPSFAPHPKQGKPVMEAFENVQVHNLVARILGVPQRTRAPTNGTWSFWTPHLRSGL